MRVIEGINFWLERFEYSSIDEYSKHKIQVDKFIVENNIGTESDLPTDVDDRTDLIAYRLKVIYDSAEKTKLVKMLNDCNIKYSSIFDFEFSKKEVKDANYFNFITNTFFLVSDNDHPGGKGTQYISEVICDTCDLVYQEQHGVLKFDTKILKKHKLVEFGPCPYGGYSLVARADVARYMQENFTGIELKEIEHTGTDKNYNEAYQIIITGSMPKLSEKMITIPRETTCPDCELTDRHIWPLHYDKSEIQNIDDFNLTEEWFTIGGNAYKYIVVSNKVIEYMKTIKVKGDYVPVVEV